ncbi:hypothetical protein MNBD_GAMMA12-726 [hydrothermal vent metagenome]|uniref:Uncharacterized protein n=1 Tax=hydrothermal vent metagenome TaxID=652676 RepID=A0A3B0YL49_9ZZZZ
MNIKFKSLLFFCVSFFAVSNIQADTLDSSSPITTVNSVIKSLLNYQPAVLWEALPKSYQSDINKMFISFSKMSDKDVFVKYSNLNRRLIAAIIQKKAMVVNTIKKMVPPAKHGQIVPALDAVLLFADVFYKSSFTYYDKIDQADLGAILIKDGTRMMKAFLAIDKKYETNLKKLGTFTPTVVASKNKAPAADTNKVIAVAMIDKDKKQVSPNLGFVQIEGRWIPLKLAKSWKVYMAKLNTTAKLPKEKMKEMNDKMRKLLPLLEQFVVAVEKVKNEAELATLPMQAMMLYQQMKSMK